MDYERPSVSRSGERPVTRWRREQEPNDKTHVFTDQTNSENSKSYNKMERPISRRGIKTDITEYGISRPPTSGGKAILSRPPSPNILSNRVATAASRMGTPNSANLTRINSAVTRGFSQPNTIIMDRPITQQGLVGVRPGSSRAAPKLNRQIQDKIYYKQLLQMKIQELNQEITSITDSADVKNIENDRPQYDRMTNDLPESEENLEAYNSGFDKNISNLNMEEIEQEAKTLKEINDNLESVLQKQKEVKTKLGEFSKEVQFKQKIAEKFADSMDPETKLKYDETYRKQNELQKEIDNLQEEYDDLLNKQFSLKEKIALSPLKEEIYSAYNKILEVSNKNKSSSRDGDATKKQIIEIEKKIADAQQELDQLDTDIDDSQGEFTYNDNKKGEDTFEAMTEENKMEELIMRLNSLEEHIMLRLERISNSINDNVDEFQLNSEDMEMFTMLMEQNFENRNTKSFEELKEDYSKLCQTSNKLEILESKLKIDKTKIIQDQIDSVQEDHFYKNDSANENSNIHQFEEKKHDGKNGNIQNNYIELLKKIEDNELYRYISIFEDKLQKISFSENIQFEKLTDNIDKTDNLSLSKVILSLANQYNTILINSIKSVY